MKIVTANINRFISEEFKKFCAILIYGPDYGLVADRCNQITINTIDATDKTNLYLNKITLKYNDVSKDSSILENEIMSLNFFSRAKVIIVDEVDGLLPKTLEEIITKNKDNIIIFKAGDLPANSSIRKFFDTNAKVASLACYNDTPISIKEYILKTLAKNNLELEDPSILNSIIDLLQGDKKIIEAELQKIILYYSNHTSLKLKIPNKVIDDIVSNNYLFLEYETLFHAIINNQVSTIVKLVAAMLSNGENIVTILRSLSNFVIKILKIKTILAHNKNISVDVALNSFSPPIFFKQIPLFKKAIQKYHLPALLIILERFTKMEIECKNISFPPEALSNMILNCLID